MTVKAATLKACHAVGMGEDVALFKRRARFAGWHPERFAQEARQPDGLRARFAEAVEAGVAADLARRIDRFMLEALTDGPRALATMGVDELAKLVSNELQAEALMYDPFKMGGRLICGPTGLGKSVAGVAALRRSHGLRPADMNALWDKDNLGRVCLWVRAFGLPNARLANGLGGGEAPLVASAIAADFLVLDDLGWESRRAGADDVVTEVIAARYDAGRITYATTGLTYQKFVDRYGSAIARRITETAGVKGEVVDLWPTKDRK
jgi:hypothetical protein